MICNVHYFVSALSSTHSDFPFPSGLNPAGIHWTRAPVPGVLPQLLHAHLAGLQSV